MKWLCLLLLVADLVYLGWELDRQTRIDASRQATRLHPPAEAGRLRLLTELDVLPAKRAPLTAAQTMAAGSPEDSDTGGMPQTGVAVTGLEALDGTLPGISITLADELLAPIGLTPEACFSFGPFTEPNRADAFEAWLKDRRSQTHRRLEEQGENPLFWIYLAPRSTRSDALATVADLRRKGVADLSIIETGNLQNAISLGLYSTQAAVNRRLRELEDKGYQAIVVPYYDAPRVYWVDAKIIGSKVIQEFVRAYPAGVNFVPVQCEKLP